MRQSDKVLDVLQRLLGRGHALSLRLKRLYLDRGFDNNGVIAYLKQQPFPTIIPLVIRGKTGGTRALLVGRKSYHTIYTRKSVTYDQETFPVHVVCVYSKGRYRRRGLYRFAYIVIGKVNMRPCQIADEYRRRFGIETSYRLMNTVRARTTSRSAEPLELCQMVSSLHTQARPAPNLASAAATRSLASMVVGDGEATLGLFFGHYYPFGRLDAIY
jgi:putative transposase